MFLHLSVSHSVHRGEGISVWCHFLSGCLVPCSFWGLCLWPHVPSGGSLSRGVSLTETPLGRDPLGQRSPVPLMVKSGCTHPTGMHSCFFENLRLYTTYRKNQRIQYIAITGTIFKFSKWHEESHREKLTSHLAAHWNGTSFVSSRSSL